MYLANSNAGEQDQDFLVQCDQRGGGLRTDNQEKDKPVPVHPGNSAGNLDCDKEKQNIEEGNGKSSSVSTIPINTGPSRFPVKETRLFVLSACSLRYFTASQ